MSDQAIITNPDAIREFMLAGKAFFTVVSTKTGKRFTYRVARPHGDDPNRPWFVGVLTEADNTEGYTYLGCLWPDKDGWVTYRYGKKSRIARGTPCEVGFRWLVDQLRGGSKLDRVEFWHAGRCGACGRQLTVPESIATGLGPVCAAKGR